MEYTISKKELIELFNKLTEISKLSDNVTIDNNKTIVSINSGFIKMYVDIPIENFSATNLKKHIKVLKNFIKPTLLKQDEYIIQDNINNYKFILDNIEYPIIKSDISIGNDLSSQNIDISEQIEQCPILNTIELDIEHIYNLEKLRSSYKDDISHIHIVFDDNWNIIQFKLNLQTTNEPIVYDIDKNKNTIDTNLYITNIFFEFKLQKDIKKIKIDLFEFEKNNDELNNTPKKICMKFHAGDKVVYRFIDLDDLELDVGF